MHPDQFQAAGKIAAEQMHQFGNGEVEERRFALRLQLCGKSTREISFDHRPPERPEMIAGRTGAVDVAEYPHVVVELFGTLKRDEDFIGQTQRQTSGSLDFRRQRRREQNMLRRQHSAGYRDDDLISRYRTFRGFDTQPFATIVDAAHRTIQCGRHGGAVLADQRAVAVEDAIIDAGIVVAVEILHREAIEIDTADIGADGVDKPVPAVSRFEQCRSRDIFFLLRRAFHTHKERRDCSLKRVLLDTRKSYFESRPLPGRYGLVDCQAKFLGNGDPRIAIGRVQPAAAQIERKAGLIDHGPGPAAEPRSRFDQETIDRGRAKPPGRGNAGGAAADHHDLDIASRHFRYST